LYISVPNLGDFLSEANQIVPRSTEAESRRLQEWWNKADMRTNYHRPGCDGGEDPPDESHTLGDEIVIAGVKQPNNPGFAIITDLKRGGLDDFLKTAFPPTSAKGGLTVLDESALHAAPASSKTNNGGFALIRQNEAIFSNSIATLKLIDAQLNLGDSGFATGDFGKQITSAYGRGAGIILAADVHRMIGDKAERKHAGKHANEAIEKSGLEDMRYLIAEHRESEWSA
jgi:hypothetical protein